MVFVIKAKHLINLIAPLSISWQYFHLQPMDQLNRLQNSNIITSNPIYHTKAVESDSGISISINPSFIDANSELDVDFRRRERGHSSIIKSIDISPSYTEDTHNLHHQDTLYISYNLPDEDLTTNYYNSYASSYNAIDGNPIVSQSLGIDQLRQEAGKYIKGKVLEVGVGTGIETAYYDWNRIEIYRGIDLSPNMLKEAKKAIESRFNEMKEENKRDIKLEVMNAQDLRLENDQVRL